jgi:hypothetical protein
MPDIALPWPMYFFLPYLVTPYWALVGGIVGAALAFWRTSSVGKAALWALVGSQSSPWLLFLVVGTWDERGGATRAVGLTFSLATAAVVAVLVAVSRAGSRRRGGS